MGYSPGPPFECMINGEVHWELKQNYIVLWNKDESKHILKLDFSDAEACMDHLKAMIV
jgi:hypothetical protein